MIRDRSRLANPGGELPTCSTHFFRKPFLLCRLFPSLSLLPPPSPRSAGGMARNILGHFASLCLSNYRNVKVTPKKSPQKGQRERERERARRSFLPNERRGRRKWKENDRSFFLGGVWVWSVPPQPPPPPSAAS